MPWRTSGYNAYIEHCLRSATATQKKMTTVGLKQWTPQRFSAVENIFIVGGKQNNLGSPCSGKP
jgi:hypothetical protein